MTTTTRRRPDTAGRAALAPVPVAPAGVRAHVAVRWFSAPFPAIAAALPPGGRVLEIGCGHGLFSAYAALLDPTREVLGVDIDADKIDAAQVAARAVEHLEIRDGTRRRRPGRTLGRRRVRRRPLPAARRRAASPARRGGARPGSRRTRRRQGDGHPAAWKVRWNTVQETVSVKVLRITEGSSFDFVDPATMGGWLTELGLEVELHRLDARRVHPHHLLVARRTDAPA